jgi:nucleoside-diphosphate-sugar epimerase
MKKVWVTGGDGFLGKYVCQILEERGYEVGHPSHNEVNLLIASQIRDYFVQFKPDSVIHLAALCGGIGANQKRPGEFYYNNIMMGTQLIEEACWFVKDKFVAVGTVCSYPKFTPVPFKEEDIWEGYPEETNAPYGLAKKMLMVQCQAYRQQYDFPGIYLIPVNLYGPGDNFLPESSHVIPALIKKIDKAIKGNIFEIEVWGTGTATREFLYVEDCARGICDAMEHYDSPEPLNLGTGKDISIKGLVELIAELMGYSERFYWNKNKPDGQPARRLDISRAEKEINWKPKVELREGLEKTIEWWRQNGYE